MTAVRNASSRFWMMPVYATLGGKITGQDNSVAAE
jgi:hypothetical protein